MKTIHSLCKIVPAGVLLLCARSAFAAKVDPVYKNGNGLATRGLPAQAWLRWAGVSACLIKADRGEDHDEDSR